MPKVNSKRLAELKALCDKYKKCARCQGKGTFLDTTYDRTGIDSACGPCGGTGLIIANDGQWDAAVALPDLIADLTECHEVLAKMRPFIAAVRNDHAQLSWQSNDLSTVLGMIDSLIDRSQEEAEVRFKRAAIDLGNALRGCDWFQSVGTGKLNNKDTLFIYCTKKPMKGLISRTVDGYQTCVKVVGSVKPTA
jgi:hypothetical protein